MYPKGYETHSMCYLHAGKHMLTFRVLMVMNSNCSQGFMHPKGYEAHSMCYLHTGEK